jgi:5-enolpyruvylshikimate-3-phosphate synthase
MAFGIAGAIAGGKTLIEEAEVAEISYPAFWEHMELLKTS